MSNVEVIQAKWKVIRPTGEIDFTNVGGFEAALDDAVRQSPTGFIIDLCHVDYFDSSGIRAILYAYARVRNAGGKIAVTACTRTSRTLIEATNLDRAPGLAICDTLEAAEEALSAD